MITSESGTSFLFILLMMCFSFLTGTIANEASTSISDGNSTASASNFTYESRTARKLGGGDDYEDLGWTGEDSGGDDKKGAFNGLLSKAVDSLGVSELMGKVKDLLSTITKSADGLKGGKGGGDEEEEWDSGHGYDVEHESDKPYPDIPIIDVPGKKKIGPPLTFGNYNRVGVGSFVDALAICIATVVWLTFFGLVLPLFYGGQLGRRRRSVSEDDFDAPEDGGKLNLLTKMVSNVLENGDCLEFMLCKGAETFPSPSRRVLKLVRFAAQIPAEKISRPASRIQRALTTENCGVFHCSRR